MFYFKHFIAKEIIWFLNSLRKNVSIIHCNHIENAECRICSYFVCVCTVYVILYVRFSFFRKNRANQREIAALLCVAVHIQSKDKLELSVSIVCLQTSLFLFCFRLTLHFGREKKKNNFAERSDWRVICSLACNV